MNYSIINVWRLFEELIVRGSSVNYQTDYCPTETWKQISFTDLDLLLPKKAGVYVIFDENHSPLYVGESSNLNNRWLNHNNWFVVLRAGAEYCRYFVTDKYKELERHLIVSLSPSLNRKYNTDVARDKYIKEFGYTPFIFRSREW